MNLRSEILFNRALLWLVMAQVVGTDNMPIYACSVVLVLLNIWESYKAWEVDE